MNTKLDFPNADWPKWEWWGSGWSAAVQILLTVIVVVFPGLNKEQEPLRFVALSLIIILLIVGPLIVWISKAGFTIHKRTKHYQIMSSQARRINEDLHQARRTIFSLLYNMTSGQVLRVKRARYDRLQNEAYLILEKPLFPHLGLGSLIVAVHLDDRSLLGVFEIVSSDDNEYVTVGRSDLEPHWLGYLREEKEITTVPYMAAIFVPQKEEQK